MLLPRALVCAHSKPGPSSLYAAPTSHVCARSPCCTHAAATEVAPAPADDLLRAAAAVRVRHQHGSSSNRQSQSQQQHHVSAAAPPAAPLRVPPNGNASQHDTRFRRPNGHADQQQQARPHQYRQQPDQQQQARPQQYRQQPDHYQQQPDHYQQDLQSQQPEQRQQQRQQQPGKRGYSIRYYLGSDQDWSLPTGLAVTWLGTSSGAPTKDRNISCTMVRVPEAVYMVDCGEGSYMQAKKTGVQLEQVDTMFITHLHGDHCFGIGGMLVSLCNARRALRQQQEQQGTDQQQQQQQQQQKYGPGEGPGALRLVGPPRLGALVTALLVGAGVGRRLDLPVYVTEFVEQRRDAHDWQPLPGCPEGQAFIRRLPPSQRLTPEQWPAGLQGRLAQTGLDWQAHPANTRRSTFQAKPGLVWSIPCQHATITAAQLQHRVPCWGYVFDEVPQQQQQQQESAAAERQQAGSNGGSSSKSAERGRRVVVMGDTVDSRAIAPVAYGADLVSHEATFAAGMEAKAAMAQHSTAWMAGQFAWAIDAKSLVLTHFSARYEGSAGAEVPGHKGPFTLGRTGPAGPNGGRGGDRNEHRVRSWEVAQAEAEAKAAEERAVMLLQREAEVYFSQGPILLAMDLFTAHVPRPGAASEAGSARGNRKSSSSDSESQ